MQRDESDKYAKGNMSMKCILLTITGIEKESMLDNM